MKRFSRLCSIALLTAACAMIAILNLAARPRADARQSSTPTPSVQPAPTASVRFWKTNLAKFPLLRVTTLPLEGKHPTRADLASGGPGYVFAGYLDVPAIRCTLELSDAPAPAAGKPVPPPLASMPADFTAGGFFTVLVSEPEKAGGPPHLEVISDGRAGEKVTQITVRSFLPDLKEAHMNIGGILDTPFGNDAGFFQMRGVKPAVYPVHISGTTTDGKPLEWAGQIDLKQHFRQTLLIYPDPYGRIRPRMSVDGENRPDR